MHESTSPTVKFNIDEIEELSSSQVKVRGWIFHEEKFIRKLFFKNTEVNFFEVHYMRTDVKEVYSYIPSSDIGFTMKLTKEDLNNPVVLLLEDGSTLEIGPFGYTEAISTSTEPKQFGFGNYKKNLIIINNFYDDPDGIREYTMNNFTFEETDYHKGARSVERFVIDGTKERLEKIIGKRILNWDAPGTANGKMQYCMATDPLVYHVDLQNYAGVVFLTPDAPVEAGNGTYRSKHTGVYRFDQPIEDEDLYFKTFAGRSNEMNFYDKTAFEEVDRVGNVYNRLVLFDSTAIHAASQYFGDSIENSRYFQLFFFDVDFNEDIT